MKDLKYDDIVQFTKNWLVKINYEWLFFGNIKPDTCRDLAKTAEELHKVKGNAQILR